MGTPDNSSIDKGIEAKKGAKESSEGSEDLSRAVFEDMKIELNQDSIPNISLATTGDSVLLSLSHAQLYKTDFDVLDRAAVSNQDTGDVILAGHDRYSQVGNERQDLLDLAENAESRVSDKGLRSQLNNDFRANTERFEGRALERGLSPEEITSTYRDVSRLLSAEPRPPLTFDDNARLANDILRNAASPTDIMQGQFNTCAVAAIECRTYTRNPAAAARLVADVAINGEYTTHDGTRVPLDTEGLRPAGGYRSHGSQLFQVTAANIHNRMFDTGRQYTHATPDADNPTGEVLIDSSGHVVPGIHEPSIVIERIDDISNQITGLNEQGFVIRARPHIAQTLREDINYWIEDTGRNIVANFGLVDEPGALMIDDPEELHDALNGMASDGVFPAVILVHTRQEPFWTDGGFGAAGGAGGNTGGWHGLTITDYDPNTRRVSVDNQWVGADRLEGDRRVPLFQLFQATLDPNNLGRRRGQ
jgi:hypothetical protein